MIFLYTIAGLIALGLFMEWVEDVLFPNHAYIPESDRWVRRDGEPD